MTLLDTIPRFVGSCPTCNPLSRFSASFASAKRISSRRRTNGVDFELSRVELYASPCTESVTQFSDHDSCNITRQLRSVHCMGGGLYSDAANESDGGPRLRMPSPVVQPSEDVLVSQGEPLDQPQTLRHAQNYVIDLDTEHVPTM
jgi:hypothetical protein